MVSVSRVPGQKSATTALTAESRVSLLQVIRNKFLPRGICRQPTSGLGRFNNGPVHPQSERLAEDLGGKEPIKDPVRLLQWKLYAIADQDQHLTTLAVLGLGMVSSAAPSVIRDNFRINRRGLLLDIFQYITDVDRLIDKRIVRSTALNKP